MAGISSLTGAIKASSNWTAQQNQTGQDYNPTTNAGTINKSYTLGTANANNAAGGADEFISFLIGGGSIAASGSATVDLTSLTNIVGTAAVSLARVKGYMIRLLSASDDATYGTACSSITVGNNASNANTLEFGTGNPTFTFNVNNGGCHVHFDTTAAGMVIVDSTHKIIKIVNNDGSNAAGVQITLFGGTT